MLLLSLSKHRLVLPLPRLIPRLSCQRYRIRFSTRNVHGVEDVLHQIPNVIQNLSSDTSRPLWYKPAIGALTMRSPIYDFHAVGMHHVVQGLEVCLTPVATGFRNAQLDHTLGLALVEVFDQMDRDGQFCMLRRAYGRCRVGRWSWVRISEEKSQLFKVWDRCVTWVRAAPGVESGYEPGVNINRLYVFACQQLSS